MRAVNSLWIRNMNDQLPITYEEMRGLVVEVLKLFPNGQVSSLDDKVAALVASRSYLSAAQLQAQHQAKLGYHGGHSPGRLSRSDSARVWSIFWDLLIEGIVRPGKNDGMNNDLPFFHVTEFGNERIKHGNSPYDPDGYIKRLQNDVPSLDSIIVAYLIESLHTFRIGCLLSSTITLGCASEKALLLLIGGYADALPEPRQKKFRQNTENRVIKRQFEEFTKMFDSHLRALLPSDLSDNVDVALNALFTIFRTERNDAGHPTGKTVTREQAYANLLVFPVYVKKVYALIEWLKANSPLA